MINNSIIASKIQPIEDKFLVYIVRFCIWLLISAGDYQIFLHISNSESHLLQFQVFLFPRGGLRLKCWKVAQWCGGRFTSRFLRDWVPSRFFFCGWGAPSEPQCWGMINCGLAVLFRVHRRFSKIRPSGSLWDPNAGFWCCFQRRCVSFCFKT